MVPSGRDGILKPSDIIDVRVTKRKMKYEGPPLHTAKSEEAQGSAQSSQRGGTFTILLGVTEYHTEEGEGDKERRKKRREFPHSSSMWTSSCE